MPRIDRVRKTANALGRLAGLGDEALLPMPHAAEALSRPGAISTELRIEYRERLRRTCVADPLYLDPFRRPSPEATDAVFGVLRAALADRADIAAKLDQAVADPRDDRDPPENGGEARGGLALLIALALGRDDAPRRITFNDVFDTVARGYSDHFVAGPARHSRGMAPLRAKRAQRDLLIQFVRIDALWRFLRIDWPAAGAACPYAIESRPAGGAGGSKGPRTETWITPRLCALTMRLRDACDAIDVLMDREILLSRPLLPPPPRTPSKLGRPAPAARFAADVPFNAVALGPRTREILALQSAARLVFDRSAFLRDYDAAFAARLRLRDILDSRGLDPTRSNMVRRYGKAGAAAKGAGGSQPREDLQDYWSARDEQVHYRSMEHAFVERRPADARQQRLVAEKLQGPGRQEALARRRAGFLQHIERRIKNGHGDPGWAERARALSVAEAALLGVQGFEWRNEVRALFSELDRADALLRAYRPIWRQLLSDDGDPDVVIDSAFRRTVNRRFQPLHMWPTYVSNKEREDAWPESDDGLEDDADERAPAAESDDERAGSYRKRWFRAPGIDGARVPLVGIDVSSSQTQIIAFLIGCEALERDATASGADRAFKAALARRAFAMDQATAGGLLRRTSETSAVAPYSGPDDSRLQNLCKGLWMAISYGGSAPGVVRIQDNDKATYGPGWRIENARRFLNELDRVYPEMKAFLAVCRLAARIAVEADPAEGFIMTDPYDGATIRWNPLELDEIVVEVGEGKLMLSVPKGVDGVSEPQPGGRYPVNPQRLRRMLAPCLIHTLDAFYSALVMERLKDAGVDDFVSIHDCWLVPERFRADGEIRAGLPVLEEAFRGAARDWYAGLEPVYLALTRYLERGDPDNRSVRRGRAFVAAAYETWRRRNQDGFAPNFLYRPD